MEDKKILLKQYIVESNKNYENYKKVALKIFSSFKDNKKYANSILLYFDINKDENYLHLFFLLFFHHQKWINPNNINFGKFSQHFKLLKRCSHNIIEQQIIKCIEQKNIMKIYVYWHFYILILFSEKFEENNNNCSNITDLENILFQNNQKIINLYNSEVISTKELYIFLYIYIFWIEYNTKKNSHEKNLKLTNNILFSLLFDLLEKTAEIIFSENEKEEFIDNIKLFFSFLDEIKTNELINNDYNVIILLDCNIIQNFMTSILKYINANILENSFPTYSTKLSEFFANFLKFRFNKSKLMDFVLNNIKNGLINLKYLESRKDKVLNDIFLQNFQSDLIQKIFSNEDKKSDHPNFNSFLFNGNNSKISFNLSKLSLNDNLIIFSFLIKSPFNDKSSSNINLPLFCFYNEKNERVLKAFIKKDERNETDRGDSSYKTKKIKYYLMIIHHTKNEKMITEFNYLESNITYLICFHLNNSFVNIDLNPMTGTNSKILSSHSEIKFNFQEQKLLLNIGFDNYKEKYECFSGYIGNFIILQLLNQNKNKIDYENNQNIIQRILSLNEYYKYIIYYLRNNETENLSMVSLDYISRFKNKNDVARYINNLDYIQKECKNIYKTILFISPDLFKLCKINGKDNIKNLVIPSISGICEKQKEYRLNNVNITFVRFENSKEVFLMKNGLNLFCLQFEYIFQFASYYNLFLNKSNQENNILSELFYEDNKETSLKLIISTINNILLMLSKYIIDLKITNFFPELKQIFSTLFSAIKSLTNIGSIIDSIFHQLSSLFVIICEQIYINYKMNYDNSKNLYTENDIKFFIGLRDSIIDILLTKDLYQKVSPKFFESFFDKIISIIESNNAKDITSTNPNIFSKALGFSEPLNEYINSYQPNLSKDMKDMKKNKLTNSYLKLLKGLLNRNKNNANENLFLNQLISHSKKESKDNYNLNYMFLSLINDLVNEGFSLEENDINDLVKYFSNLCKSKFDESQENDKIILCNLVVSIIITSLFTKNKKINFHDFYSEIKQLYLNENLFLHIINEILKIFSNYMDIQNIKIRIINSDENNNKSSSLKTSNDSGNILENFDFNHFYDGLFEFILILFQKYENKKAVYINQNNQNDIEENQKESKIIINNSQNKSNRIILELINLIFFIEEMISAHINNKAIQITTIFCLLNLVKLIHIFVFDDKLINIFTEDKSMLLFKSMIESCINSKLIFTNFYLNPYENSPTFLKTIPETLLDILMKLVKSDIIKNYKDQNKISEYTLTKNDIISFLNEIFFINVKLIGQDEKESQRSLFCYNDLYRYFFSKKINNPENELKSINKNKTLMKYFNKFGDDFIYLYKINNLLSGKKQQFNYNFITFNLEKIYKYKNSIDFAEIKDLTNLLNSLFIRLEEEHQILYQLDKDFFFKTNSDYSHYSNAKNKIEHILSAKKDIFDVGKDLDLIFQGELIDIEFIYSGLCEKVIKETKRRRKSINDLHKTKTELPSSKEQTRKIMRSSTELGASPGQILNNDVKSPQFEENNTFNSRTNSFMSSELESPQNEDNKSLNESSSTISNDNNEKQNLSSSFNTFSNTNNQKALPLINTSYSSLLSENQANVNINIDINNIETSSSSNPSISKKQLENDINCNFLNELDDMYLFNVKRDLMKNIFSLNFLDTIFYDKTFIELRKIFYQIYEKSLESPTQKFPTLDYPTKIKNFSNGLEPALFLSPNKDFYLSKTFPLTHAYFNKFKEYNIIKLKNESINLIKKQISIPQNNITYQFNCELIKINHALYGNITYSKTGNYLYFEQQNFEEIYKANIDSFNFEGIFTLSCVKLREKENIKNKKSNKKNKLFHKSKKVLILLNDIEEIVERRILLMWQGLEIYLKDGRSYLFNLLESKKLEKFEKYLFENEDLRLLFHRKDYLTKNKYITKAWEKNNITTYEYLLLINKYASRSLNDPSQYHVFPWIISRFENLIAINKENDLLVKEKLKENKEKNLENEEKKDEDNKNLLDSLRNLKYPLSLQTETGRSFSIFRYNDEDNFHFHLGTHYSTSPFVFYYLMRQEPFDTLLVKLQNYQLENANRMFIGVKETVEILESGNDNRELIPEFFSKIEFFMNLNYSFYGIRSNKKIVHNVKLDFIKNDINAPILISDYVHFIIEHKNLLNSNLISLNINEWINNIFGSGQYPPEKNRKDCCNIFRKTTYEKFTNLSNKIEKYKKNERHKNYKNSQIRAKILNKANLILCFGQTPSKVFKDPHPKKEIDSSDSKVNTNSLSYNKKYSLDEKEEDDFENKFSTLLRPSKYQSKIMIPCIYFDVNKENKKIFALSLNDIVEINFSINNEKDSDITVLSYQNVIKIPRMKLFENFNLNDIEYYVYKPKYAFSSFKGCDFVDYASRKESKISKDSKNVISDKNFYFNNYYKFLFNNMYLKKNNDNQAEEINKFVICRYLDNSFKILKYTKIKNPKKKQKETSISSFSYLCEDFVSSCCNISANQFLTGLDNGKLIRWNIIKEEKDKLEINFDKNIQAHRGRITAIEIDLRLGLVITCGKDNLVQIRKLYNLELITPIKIKKKLIITMAKISPANFLYILCFDIKGKKSVLYGYTLTGIKFAKNKGGVYSNIDFTRSGNIVSLLNNKELCILNSYDLTKKDILYNQIEYKEDLEELKNIEGASWLKFIYFVKKPDSDNYNRINYSIIYIKKGKNKENNLIYYYEFKSNKIFE